MLKVESVMRYTETPKVAERKSGQRSWIFHHVHEKFIMAWTAEDGGEI